LQTEDDEDKKKEIIYNILKEQLDRQKKEIQNIKMKRRRLEHIKK
jgi:hypothetical protein